MMRISVVMLVTTSSLAIAASGWAAETNATDCILFSESFEDADLHQSRMNDPKSMRERLQSGDVRQPPKDKAHKESTK